MVSMPRVAGVISVSLLAMTLLGGCDWVVSQETRDFSHFQEFRYTARASGDPEDVVIKAVDGGYTVAFGEWDFQQQKVVFGEPRDLSADQVGRMQELFGNVLLVQSISLGKTCPPTGVIRELEWDDFAVSAVGCTPSGTLLLIDWDNSEQVSEFLAESAKGVQQ